jgi:hypothetical protein
MKKLFLSSISIVLVVLAVPTQSTIAGDKPFPKIVETLAGSFPEGFAIGKGSTAYNSSPLGSIYKVDLRSGQGEVLVPVQNPDPSTACVVLGMRVDPRTNYLFAAGCFNGNAFVYDADTGALIMEYQLAPPFTGVVNDLTITKDAVYFTDSFRPVLYRLPLSENGGIPLNPGAATEIPLPAEFELDFLLSGGPSHRRRAYHYGGSSHFSGWTGYKGSYCLYPAPIELSGSPRRGQGN